MAVMLHGSGVAGLDMASATIKMNGDSSFYLLIGATDIGTGSDTILAQIAAEALGCALEDLVVYSSDTDFTPFDKGAYASSTTYLSGEAVRKAAAKVARQVKAHGARCLGLESVEGLELRDGQVVAPDGRSASFETVALNSLHIDHQHQIIGSGSHMSYESPTHLPPSGPRYPSGMSASWQPLGGRRLLPSRANGGADPAVGGGGFPLHRTPCQFFRFCDRQGSGASGEIPG